ncbi:hypothetical protein ABUE31_22290 [Mesorhizobium sp. ZMM04-5]|uniref:DUF945 domain-containing protein n=1 Tax=Mesorhizobium marinum TaxID=3228790 RepID=A0ABV3R5Z4_9HYPH
MAIHSRTLGRLALGTFLLGFPFHQASAQDAQAVAEQIKAVAAAQGTAISWAGVSGDASSMVLQGVSVKATSDDDAVMLGDVTLSNVVEENGGYTVGTTTTSPLSVTSEGFTFDMSPIVIKGWKIPSEDATDPLATLSLYERADVASIAFKMADKTVFSMAGLSSSMSDPQSGPMDFVAGIESFTGDLSGVSDPQTKAAIDAFGYQTISGSAEMSGTWNPADGVMKVTRNDVTVADAGTLGVTFGLGGYTLDFVKSIQDVQKKIAAQPEGDTTSAAEMELLGLMQQLSFSGASIRFDDDSLTDKIIDFVAKQQGQKREDIVNLAKATLPFMLAQMEMPDLVAALVPAINTYLDKPESIEITAAPPAPVPFTMLGGAAMAGGGNPAASAKALWTMLGVTVTANQP